MYKTNVLKRTKKQREKHINFFVQKLMEQIRRIHYTCLLPLFVISYGRIIQLFAWLFQFGTLSLVLLTNPKAVFFVAFNLSILAIPNFFVFV